MTYVVATLNPEGVEVCRDEYHYSRPMNAIRIEDGYVRTPWHLIQMVQANLMLGFTAVLI